MRFRLLLEYDGSAFSGWQKQKNAETIQGTLIDAIGSQFSKFGHGRFIDLQGAGRTDAGVHAFGQVAHLDCETRLKPQALKNVINEALPPAINLLKVEPAAPDFHARHSAKSRQYLYRIGKRRNVFERQYMHVVTHKLDLPRMQAAAGPLLGMHDFSSFSSDPQKEKAPMVLLQSLELFDEDEALLIRVKASHFLWSMVRILTGTLIEAGAGRLSPEQVRQALESYNPKLASLKAPACGLFLEAVEY